MQKYQTAEKLKNFNFYKILFHKHETFPVGHFSRNLINKIKDSNHSIEPFKEKNSEYFNPISDNNSFKIQKIYSKFQRSNSAKRFPIYSNQKNKNKNKKNNKLIYSQNNHLSQYSTLLDYSKYIPSSRFYKKINFRPMSHVGGGTTMFLDKFPNQEISKIIKNKNKKNLKIKKDFQRSSSAFIFNHNNTTKRIELLKENSTLKNLLKHEEQMKEQKKLLKGRLLTALSRHLVINQETLKNYDMLYREEQKDNKEYSTPKKIGFKEHFNFINHHPDYFSKIRPPFRYEDYYFSPLELIEKYFTKEEIIILKSSPEYFGLNKFPFKNSIKFNPTLLSKFDLETPNSNFNKSQYTEKKINNKSKFDLKKEMKKIKNIFKERKKEKVKREPIKGKDFVSHYEREIEPDEGTVSYFERKYNKYMVNKEKNMEKKINDLKYKKSRFEYLRNLRTKKLEEEKNIQRITMPVIDIIKRNYLRANSNINI